MTKGFVIGTGCAIAGTAIAILVYNGVNTTRLVDRREAAVMEALRSPVDWPGQQLSDDPEFQQFGDVYANVNTDWDTDETGNGQLSYSVSLTPAKVPVGLPFSDLIKQCHFSLAFNDSQGMLVTSVPLDLVVSPGPDGAGSSLTISSTAPMSAAAYADMIGASVEGESGTLQGSVEVAGECQPPPQPPGRGLRNGGYPGAGFPTGRGPGR